MFRDKRRRSGKGDEGSDSMGLDLDQRSTTSTTTTLYSTQDETACLQCYTSYESWRAEENERTRERKQCNLQGTAGTGKARPADMGVWEHKSQDNSTKMRCFHTMYSTYCTRYVFNRS